ncbi:MAG TPA: hypothetical protein GX401_03970 [Clostridiales bacterium]|nr:hypothetical protein [Clostridiales bacterium]
MDDISGKISELLSDPQALQQIMSLTSLLGGGGDDEPEPKPLPPPKKDQNSSSGFPNISSDSMETVMKLMPVLSGLKQEDDTTRLLRSLRPFLGEERQQKLDEATKMLQLLKMLPVIKEFNFLSG